MWVKEYKQYNKDSFQKNIYKEFGNGISLRYGIFSIAIENVSIYGSNFFLQKVWCVWLFGYPVLWRHKKDIKLYLYLKKSRMPFI